MDDFADRTRREALAAVAGFSLGSTLTSSAFGQGIARPEEPVLVAYFSRTGNTRVVAGLIQRAFGADMFEIVPANPYPDEYLATVEQARQERDKGVEPPLKAKVPDIARYATVFLGLPIWGETAPPLIRSFLSSHDLSAKALLPFITHGGYGLGNSERVIARHAPRAQLRPAFTMQADQERQTMDRVNAWLGNRLAKPR
ncbi:flavodoxin [Variovorax saccharolyticus]|uniref:flavodoxin n=1 Tax=Variovorax saccharolyticus TaxID=3053516 RepID=UPI002575AD1B|nr:flavodoxin [Variovorax sp. J22R187]MDM0022401.1 flavodoxin [Variovorax sp. J22R187]